MSGGLSQWLGVPALVPLVIPPAYIAIVAVAEKKWGPLWSGRLTAIPTQTTTVILIVALAQGSGPAGIVAAGALLGVISLSAFAVGYGVASLVMSWKGAIAVAVSAFLLAAVGLVKVHGSPTVDSIAAVGAIAATLWVLSRIRSPVSLGQRTRLGLTVRMGSATVLVLLVALSVPFLGPVAAGTLGVFPIVTAPMTVLNHRDSGAAASRRYLEGLEWGLVGGVAFFLALSLLCSTRGTGVAFAVGIPVLVGTQLACFFLPERLSRPRTAP